MAIALSIDKLTCIRGHRAVFRDLCLSVHGGTLVSIEGPNGAGKTSLLRLLAGFLRPAAGSITLTAGDKVATDPEERGVFAGWLGHQDALKPQMSVAEQVHFWCALYRSPHPPEEAMRRFGIAALADLPGQFLSAGQRRRLGLVRLVLSNRPLWLLDEPLAALDTNGKALVAETIARQCASGGIVLSATHDPLGLPCETLRLGTSA